MSREKKPIAKNRRAFHDYEIIETFEAGIVLSGTEVRSLRENNCQLTDTFALIRHGEAWLHGLHIPPYSHGNIANREPDRVRKLLLHRRQIRYLEQKTRDAGMAMSRSKSPLRAARSSMTSAPRWQSAIPSGKSSVR